MTSGEFTLSDCPAFSAHEITARILGTSTIVNELRRTVRQDLDTIEATFGRQFNEWTDFITRTLEDINDRAAIADSQNSALREEYQRAFAQMREEQEV